MPQTQENLNTTAGQHPPGRSHSQPLAGARHNPPPAPEAFCPPRAAILQYLHVVHPGAPRPRLIAEDGNTAGGTDAFSWNVRMVVAPKLDS